MRVGRNPLTAETVPQIAPIVAAVITHLPTLEGYHKNRLEVIQTCIQSMTKNAGTDFSLLVWDNGSCESLRKWLRKLNPSVLVESTNIGKSSARAAIFRMLPPKTVVAMSDDDILFYPGWLAEQIKVLKAWPNVSCVSGNPIRTSFRWACENTIRWMEENANLITGRMIPERYEQDFCDSIGRDYEKHKLNTAKEQDYRGMFNGVPAYATSHHCQFVSIAGKVAPVLKFDNAAMADEKPFDNALDNIGLRLCTTQRYSRHIGNVIHEQLRKEIVQEGLC
jgi:glycosyltransferase involved in cell wall biosynthesis